MPELLDRLARDGELRLAPEVAQLVRRVSPATLGRLLAPARATRPRRGATTTHAGTWLRHEIPIRTFTEWDDAGPMIAARPIFQVVERVSMSRADSPDALGNAERVKLAPARGEHRFGGPSLSFR